MKKKVLSDNNNELCNFDLIDEIENEINTQAETIYDLLLEKIRENQNIRKNCNEEKILEMAESIKQKGLLQPITVVKADDGFYEIIFGHRRYKAIMYLHKLDPKKYFKIKCIVKDKKDFNADEIKEIQLIENIQIEDLAINDIK